MVDRSNYCATNIESHLDPNLGRFRFPWKSVMSVRTQQSIRPDLLSSCSPYHSPCLSPLMLLALTGLTVCSLLFLYDKGVSPDMARSKKYRQAARCFCVTVLCCLVSDVFGKIGETRLLFGQDLSIWCHHGAKKGVKDLNVF